jgi:hypothetical protein
VLDAFSKNIFFGGLKMKFLLTIFISLVLNASFALAEVYECSSASISSDTLLALSNDSGLSFTKDHGYYRENDEAVKVVRAADGGPVIVVVGDSEPTIDWSKESECYKFISAIRWSIKLRSTGDVGSTVEHLGVVRIKPGVACNPPRPMRIPPQKAKCKLL